MTTVDLVHDWTGFEFIYHGFSCRVKGRWGECRAVWEVLYLATKIVGKFYVDDLEWIDRQQAAASRSEDGER